MSQPSRSLRTFKPEERFIKVFGEDALKDSHPPIDLAEALIENTVGYFSIPLGIAEHFRIDGRRFFIPLAIEETSVVASASAAAKWIGEMGGVIRTSVTGNEIVGQIHIPEPKNPESTLQTILDQRQNLIDLANQFVPSFVNRGAGFTGLRANILQSSTITPMVVLDFFFNPGNAMGANAVTQALEKLKSQIQTLTGDRIGMAIVSNLNDRRIFEARIEKLVVPEPIGKRIEEASQFAELDPTRAATHNKGIFNAVDALLIATGNDWRAVEAGGHAFSCRNGHYGPLSTWRYSPEDGLVGILRMPVDIGIVGGVTELHPLAKMCLKILEVQSSTDLGKICVAVGLVQNLAALRALTGDGLSKGHMRLHAANLARSTGASPLDQSEIVGRLIRALDAGKTISQTDAESIFENLKKEKQ